MGRLMPLLQDLCNWVTRVYAVVRNTVNQLAVLYHDRQKLFLSTFKEVCLDVVFEALGVVLRTLVTLDAIIADNANLALAWNCYKRYTLAPFHI